MLCKERRMQKRTNEILIGTESGAKQNLPLIVSPSERVSHCRNYQTKAFNLLSCSTHPGTANQLNEHLTYGFVICQSNFHLACYPPVSLFPLTLRCLSLKTTAPSITVLGKCRTWCVRYVHLIPNSKCMSSMQWRLAQRMKLRFQKTYLSLGYFHHV